VTHNLFASSGPYRSLSNDSDLKPQFNNLEFWGTPTIVEASGQFLNGTLGGPGWSLALHGSRGYGRPMQVRCERKGLVAGEELLDIYVRWLMTSWSNNNERLQRPAIVGSMVRIVAHSSRSVGTAPTGVGASFGAVQQN